MKVNGNLGNMMEKVLTNIKMNIPIKAAFRKAKSMVEEKQYGMMVESMTENLNMTKRADLDPINGQLADYIQEIGGMVDNMGKAKSLLETELRRKDIGKMEIENTGIKY